MKKAAIGASIAMAMAMASGALGYGMIRSPGVASAGHSALSVGAGIFSYSTTSSASNYYGAANPFQGSVFPTNVRPFQDSTGGSYGLFTDVAANPTGSANYGTNQLPFMNWYFNTAASSGTRIGLDAAGGTNNESQSSYSGNGFNMLYSGIGNPGQLGGTVNASISIQVFDGLVAGQSWVDMAFTVTRVDAGLNTITLDVGNEVDLDIAGSAGNTVSSLGSGYFKFTQASNFGEVLASANNPTGNGTFSTLAASRTAVNTALKGSGALAGSITNGTDTAAGFLWNDITLAPGESKTFKVSFSVNATVPTPGSIAILGLGGLIAARRRR